MLYGMAQWGGTRTDTRLSFCKTLLLGGFPAVSNLGMSPERIILTFGEQMSLRKNIYMVPLLQKSFQIEKK